MGAAHDGRAAIVLAAGASTRMGQPKALLPWRGSTLVEYAVEGLLAAGAADVVVVLGAVVDEVRNALPPHPAVRWAVNEDYLQGRSSSIRVGASTLRTGCSAILVTSVDQPCPSNVMERLFEVVERGATLAVPSFGGRRGHPPCFSGRLLPELRTVDESTEGLRGVVGRYRDERVEVPVETADVLLNLNDAAAYEAASGAKP